MRPFVILALLTATVPALAQAPAPPADTSAPPATATAATPAPAAASGPPAALLDSLVGKTQIVALTKQDGTRYLCRFNAGDHGQYVVQEFHFAGPPKTTTQTEAPVAGKPVAHTKIVTIGSGRTRQRIPLTTYTPGPTQKGKKVQVKTGTLIADDEAVRLLLAGAAGSIRTPQEVMAARDLFTPADVKYLQLLSPPTKQSTAKTTTAATTTATTGTPAPVSASAWTLTTLWPTTSGSSTSVTRRTTTKKKTRQRTTKSAAPVPSP